MRKDVVNGLGCTVEPMSYQVMMVEKRKMSKEEQRKIIQKL